MSDMDKFETQQTITFGEFKAWMSGLLQGKEGKLPGGKDWVLIERMMDKVVPDKETTIPWGTIPPTYPQPDIYPTDIYPPTAPFPTYPSTPAYPGIWCSKTFTSNNLTVSTEIPEFTSGEE